MKHLTLASLLVALIAGCGDNTTDPPVVGEVKPRESEWETVVNALPFPLTGDGKINQLTIGRKEFSENYANRGNIDVLYDHRVKLLVSAECQAYDLYVEGRQASEFHRTVSRLIEMRPRDYLAEAHRVA